VPEGAGPAISRILLGVDLSDAAQRAVEWCTRFAMALDAEVLTTTVVTPEMEVLSDLDGTGLVAWAAAQRQRTAA
jgi:nucleotide-binding universal stress UspA family protein